MSRFDDYDYEEQFPNAGELWAANARRALQGKRGKKALAELREALLALPERRLIAGALCTVGGAGRDDRTTQWARDDMADKVGSQGEGVCAIGAYVWYRKVKAGMDPQVAFAELPTLLDSDGDADWQTAEAGRRAGLTLTLASSLAYRNDATFEGMTPERRFEAFMEWIDSQLADAATQSEQSASDPQ
jgi:hypothetical protein